MSVRQDIDAFLAKKRVAVVGVSTGEKDFSRELYKELKGRGYDVVPVNPRADSIEGDRCFPSVADIAPPAEAALIMTSSRQTDAVVKDCHDAGVRFVWMFRAVGQGAVTQSAVSFCRDNGISVIPGECPFMFLPNCGFPHSFHGMIRRAFHAELR